MCWLEANKGSKPRILEEINELQVSENYNSE